MKTFLLYIFFTLFIISCNNKYPPSLPNNRIKQIFFATGGCYGQCPYLAIEIDSSLCYNFEGNKFAEKFGFFHGKISEAFWDSVNSKLESMQFERFDTLFANSVDDLSTEIIIYYGNKRKHIIGQSKSLPPKLMELYNWLLDSYKEIDLKPVFQTSIQNPFRLPPPPIYLKSSVNVTPPKK